MINVFYYNNVNFPQNVQYHVNEHKRRNFPFLYSKILSAFSFFLKYPSHSDFIMSDYKKSEFQEKVQKLLSGEDTSIKRSRRSEDSTEDIKGICKQLNII